MVDKAQFLQTFYEESYEGLDAMESDLLNLEPGSVDEDLVHTIFRAAHSIKGGAGTFGLTEIASFTHLLETLLDEMRDGKREVKREAVDLMLRAVDCLRNMLARSQNGETVEDDEVNVVRQWLQSLLDTEGEAKEGAEPSGDDAAEASSHWRIAFRPYEHLFRTGNDPLRIFRELASLGELTVEADLSGLPALADMDPESSYGAWNLELDGVSDRGAIEEAFAWVEDDCELALTPINEAGGNQAEADSEALDGEVLVERRKGGDRRQGDRRAGDNSSSIRVDIDKVDNVINLVGELVITQSMLSTLGEDFDMGKVHQLQNGLTQLERHTRELQEQVMRMRMLPIGVVFNRFPRMVHDLSAQLDKDVHLDIQGENTELDKTLIEKISDPLVHLVRNSLDHGIETRAERVEAGKPETGVVSLNAYHKGGNIVIDVIDDGRGLDADKILNKAWERGLVPANTQLSEEQTYDLLFTPGFSTADEVSDLSGRGVGMDVVRRNIEALGGSVEVRSQPGAGSRFTVRLPLTLAIVDGQTVSVGNETYIIPLGAIIESLQVDRKLVNEIAGRGETFRWRDEYLPVVRLYEAFGAEPHATQLKDGLLVVVEGEGRRVALFVDDLHGQQQVVIKSLETNYQKVSGISGATILGDGSVALILDIPALIRASNQEANAYDYRKRA